MYYTTTAIFEDFIFSHGFETSGLDVHYFLRSIYRKDNSKYLIIIKELSYL